MRPRPLHDEHDKQQQACREYDYVDDVDAELEFGADPFDVIAALEEELGTPLARS